jgi:hypothetical protein
VTDWMTIRIVLQSGEGVPIAHPPGRVFLLHADHSFADLGEAVDASFGRWDLAPGHEFRVEGRRLVSDEDAATADDDFESEPSDDVTIGESGLRLGSRFAYLFDPEVRWVHDCTVEGVAVDPFELYGEEPDLPVAVDGWGTLPDQYGRLLEDDEGVDEVEVDVEVELDDLAADVDTDAGGTSGGLTSWAIVEQALADADLQRDDPALQAAAARLRRRADGKDNADEWPYDVLWAAGGMAEGEIPDDDEALWLELAAGVISPRDPVPLDPETDSAWAALEPADWAGAIIELVRAGVGQPADAESLLELIGRCPEVESDALSEEDEEVLLAGLEVAVTLWAALGAVDEDRRLTRLGRWGLPESLRLAWVAS